MLISQQIALRENAIKFNELVFGDGDKVKIDRSHPDLSRVRLAIMQATKIIVPSDLLDLDMFITVQDDKFWQANKDEIVDRNLARYKDFARLPFNSVFIENSTGGYLVTKDPHDDTAWLVFIVENLANEGICLMYLHFRIWPREISDDGYVSCESLRIGQMAHGFPLEVLGGVRKRIITIACYQIFEALLFLNVRNSVTHFYQPKKEEVKRIAPQFRKFYNYRIIDIYRERVRYESLNQIETDINTSLTKQSQPKRAHFVRGHFKNIRGNLYWWNAFMRNRRNIITLGVVEKDYALKLD